MTEGEIDSSEKKMTGMGMPSHIYLLKPLQMPSGIEFIAALTT